MGHKLHLSGGVCIMLALMLLILPMKWILAASVAAYFHEACHYLAILACTGHKSEIRFFSFGARLPLPSISHKKEILCALAGPMGGLFLLLFLRWLPRVALCGLFQSVYNLLPIYPLDGGRAVCSLTSLLLSPPKARLLCNIIENICIGAAILFGLCAFFLWKLGLLPLIAAILLILRTKFAKMPCKVGQFRVQ